MPKFQRPEPKPYKINLLGAAEAAQAEVDEERAFTTGVANSIVGGLTFNTGDELRAAIMSAVTGEEYENIRADYLDK